MQTDVLLVTYTVLLPTNPCCNIILNFLGTLPAEIFFR